jgi:inosose dehydratase
MVPDWKMERRTFLKSQAMTGIAAVVGMSPIGCSSGSEDGFGGFRVGAHSFCFRNFPGPESVKFTAELGLTEIEIYPKLCQFTGNSERDQSIPPYYQNPDAWQEMQQAMRLQGLIPSAAGCVETFNVDPVHDRNIFEWARASSIQTLAAVGITQAKMDILEGLVQEYGITLGLHNHGPRDRHSGTVDILREAFARRPTGIGLCSDIGAWHQVNQDPIEATKIFGDRIHNVHFKDVRPNKQQSGKFKSVAVGDGILDIRGVLIALKDIGYTGLITLELIADQNDPLTVLQKSLANLRDITASI